MIVQACLNGARPDDFHPRLPITAEAIALDGAACVSAGAAELHIHPRGPDGRESLLAVDEAMHWRTRCSDQGPDGGGTGLGVTTTSGDRLVISPAPSTVSFVLGTVPLSRSVIG